MSFISCGKQIFSFCELKYTEYSLYVDQEKKNHHRQSEKK